MYLFALFFYVIIIFCLTAIETRWRFSCCVTSMSCSKFTNMAAVNSCAILPRSVTRCRMAAVSPCTVLTPPIGLSEPVLHWLQSDVVAHGLRCAKKVRVAVRRRQALRRERRLERSVNGDDCGVVTIWETHRDRTCLWCFGPVKPSEPPTGGVARLPFLPAASAEPSSSRRGRRSFTRWPENFKSAC